MSPLQIKMALAYYCSSSPELMFPKEQWESLAADSAREWLHINGLIEWDDSFLGKGGWIPTEKLKVYVTKLCSIPLPVAVHTWEFP